MKVFVAGATGAIGRQLVPRLVNAGHEVHGMTRSAPKLQLVRDLGATPWQAFLRVTLPLSRPSILAGSALVVLPMFGDYYTNDLISASPRTNMLGNEINIFVQGGSEKNLGASLVLVLMAILAIGMAYYIYQTARDQRRQLA